MELDGINKNNTINGEQEESMTMEERHREVLEGTVFRNGASLEEIYNAMIPMPEVDIEARIAEIQEDLKRIAEEVRSEQAEYVRDARKLQLEIRLLELFPEVKIRMEMLERIKKSMTVQKAKKLEEARKKLAAKEQEADLAQDNIGLIDSIEERIKNVTKQMKAFKRSDPKRTELSKRIQHLKDMRKELGERGEYERTILETKNAKTAIEEYEANSPEDRVIKACGEPWKMIFANMEFKDISKLREEDIKDKLGIPKREGQKAENHNETTRKSKEPIQIWGRSESAAEAQSDNEPNEKKPSKIVEFFTKVPVVKNIINLTNYFRREKKGPELLLSVAKELKTERTELRKAVMDEAIRSSSQNLIANEVKLKAVLSQEEYEFYLKEALKREEIDQDRQKAIDAKAPTYKELIKKARENGTIQTESVQAGKMTEEQKVARTELRKRVMSEAIKSSSQDLIANELELKKALSQEEYNWYLKEALRREKIESMRQIAITTQNEQLSRKGVVEASQAENTEQDEITDTASFRSRRRTFIGRMGAGSESTPYSKIGTTSTKAKEEGERIA